MGAGFFWALISACGFASLGFFVKELYARGFSTTDALAWRFGISSLALWLFLGVAARHRLERKGFLRAFLLGIFGFSAQACIYFSAVKFLSVSLAGLLLYTYPAFVVLLAWISGRRTPRKRELGAVLLSLLGAALVLSPEVRGASPWGVMLGLACGLWYAFYLTVSERVLSKVDPLLSTAAVSLGCACVYLGDALLRQGSLRLPTGGGEWSLLLGLSALATVLPIAGMFEAIRSIGASRASLVSSAEVVVTVALGALLLGERLTGGQWMGGTLIFVAVLAARVSSSKE